MKRKEQETWVRSKGMTRMLMGVSIITMYYGCATHSDSRNMDKVDTYDISENAPVNSMEPPAACMAPPPADYSIPLADEMVSEVPNTEHYTEITENTFAETKEHPLSTFSIDVDKASYSNIRRFLTQNQLPPKNAVRVEEMINYFKYDYLQPHGEVPFTVQTELASSPWNKQHQLVHIGIQGKSLDYDHLKPSNLVFLIDVSGSMDHPDKLPLVKSSLKMLIESLSKKDRIALVAYAGNAGLILPSTSCDDKETIKEAIDRLGAGGSTAGGEGIQLAYKVAKDNLIADGNNRVILTTDGDFNVGVSSPEELLELVNKKRNENIYLTVCGFGTGNYKDAMMEQLSNKGNGNYFYIDNVQEAKKVFITEMRANLFTIAKDVKIQVEFNPAFVQSYRLIGYEDRILNKEDFNNDKKDAGELGAGHTVTALYEIIPVGVAGKVDKLKYQKEASPPPSELNSNELMQIKLRYKPIHSTASKLIQQVVLNTPVALEKTSDNFRFATAVAGFGMLLRNSENIEQFTYADDQALAKTALSKDEEGYRSEFLKLLETASVLSQQSE